jgi:hypothetical protein
MQSTYTCFSCRAPVHAWRKIYKQKDNDKDDINKDGNNKEEKEVDCENEGFGDENMKADWDRENGDREDLDEHIFNGFGN